MSDFGPEEQYFRLKPVYRSLYRAARAAERAESAADGGDGAVPDKATLNPVHTQIRQQVADLLSDTELSTDERNRILDSIACPCCGGSGSSFSLSIKPMGKGGF